MRNLRLPPPDHPMREVSLPLPEEHTLSNGLRVWLLPDNRAPVVEFRLVLPTGGRAHDHPDWVGVSSATARLMTAGTPTRTSLQIAETADSYGGAIGFSANTETATMNAHCLSDYTPKMLTLISEVLTQPTFPPEEIEIDRANTLERLRLQRSQPDFLAHERFLQALFGNHPYSRYAPSETAIQNWTQQHLWEFHQRHYCPQGAVWIVVGDFTPRQMLAWLEETLGNWQGTLLESKLPDPNTEPVEKGVHLVPRPNSVQSNLIIGTLCPPRSAPENLEIQLGTTVLGGGTSSRLFMTIREQYGYAYSVFAQLDHYRRLSAFNASAQTATENTRDALREIQKEVNRLVNKPIPDAELQATKNYLIGRHLMGWITLGGIADRFVQVAVHGLPMDYWHTYPERLQSLTGEVVQQTCARYLLPERMSAIIVGDPSLSALETAQSG